MWAIGEARVFGELVRAYRRRSGMTQEDLAEKAGVSVRSISKLEGGHIETPRSHTVRLLADALALDGADRDRFYRAASDDPAGAAATDVTTAGDATGPDPDGIARPTPAQLPADAGAFTGRRAELGALSTILADTGGAGCSVAIAVIGGAGGIGKTRLAVRWAHRHRDRFPDGQLFVNLRGFEPCDEPLSAAAAVRGFLDALGVPAEAVPLDFAARVGLYRSLVAERRMLIVLDNARDAEQVADLIPGSGRSAVLITSRNQLAGLITSYGARPVALDVLDEAHANDLLASHLGQRRLADEPAAARRLVAACGGLPLALSLVASRAVLTPRVGLGAIADELDDAATRLRTFDDEPESGLSAVLSSSYATLTPVQARAFALLGVAPGPDISAPAAAALTGLPPAETRAVLRSLARQSLLGQPTPGRWRMHDLVRLYAAERAHDRFDADRRAGLRRLVDYLLHTAYDAERLLFPYRQPVPLEPPSTGGGTEAPADEAAAWAWFDGEYATVLAAQQLAAEQGWHDAVWLLAWCLSSFHTRRGHVHDFVAVWRAALASARRLGSVPVQALAHQRLGRGCGLLGSEAEATAHLDQAKLLAEQAGDLDIQAETQMTLGWLLHVRGQNERAIEQFTRALRLYREMGSPIRESETLNAIGFTSSEVGRFAEARTFLDAALTITRRHRHRFGEAVVLNSLSRVAHRTGDHVQALRYSRAAYRATRGTGSTYVEATILQRMGEILAALGEAEEARDAWQQALRLCRTQHRTAEVDEIQRHLHLLPAESRPG